MSDGTNKDDEPNTSHATDAGQTSVQINQTQSSPTTSTPSALVLQSIMPRSILRRESAHARTMRENISHIVDEVRPYLEHARTNLLHRQMSMPATSSTMPQTPNTAPMADPLNVILTIDSTATGPPVTNTPNDVENESPSTSQTAAESSGSRRNSSTQPNETSSTFAINVDADGEENATNNAGATNDDTTAGEALRQLMPEVRSSLETLARYVPFILILLGKATYDHREGIVNIAALLVTFIHTNSVLTREVSKQQRRSLLNLSLALFYNFACIFFVVFVFNGHDRLYMSLILMANLTYPPTIWKLLWTVAVNDFVVKLATISVKALVTLLPPFILPFQKRGKVYLFIEALSQCYRSLLPIQPWLWFLIDAYTGAERVMGVLLSASYMVAKGGDLGTRLKFLKNATCKLLQNVSIGAVATKEQLQTAGEQCSICHDSFTKPVALQPCQHIFCEACVSAWLDREPTCPLCRATVSDDPAWRDGSTTFFIQLY